MPRTPSSRRKFLQQLGSTGLLLSTGELSSLAGKPAEAGKAKESKETEKTGARTQIIPYEKKISANDRIRIACVGMGIMGNNDVNTALKVPGVELAAVCDLYTGRLERARELHGKDLFTTRDYREILQRKDIDAVLIATSDNWHSRIAIDALNHGKAVYGEKPMVQQLSEGIPLIEAWKRSKKTMQIGSQCVSSIVYAKARERYQAGEIGKLSCIEASFDRQSALGAWEYTLPTDASPKTVDWDRYIAGTPASPYDAKKFFWWRHFRSLGTGVAGDLFVHLISGIHVITGSQGPDKIYASGQIAYWKDGREVPDIMTAIMSYPETPENPAFQLAIRVNFISGQGETSMLRLIGSEGVMELDGDGFTIRHHKMSKAPGIGGWDSLATYPQAMQDELQKQYSQRWSADDQKEIFTPPSTFRVPDGYDMHLDHFTNFFQGVRSGTTLVEDPVFGFRASAPCLAANESYFHKKIIEWDPVNMKLKS
ncbi:MAG: Gfo/Idh/MocA family oxidoreductase [Puia sp.]|nr:Gfo/Idh/MocA family oxidoreductase [Puia sp.]